MTDIANKVRAAFTKDQQQILRTFHSRGDGCSWENFYDCLLECRDVYTTLLDIEATEEAAFYKKVVEDCFGEDSIASKDMAFKYYASLGSKNWNELKKFDEELDVTSS